MPQKIPFNDGDKKKFYEQLGSRNFSLQGKVTSEYAKKKIDIYYKSLNLTTTVISVVGIIAGFGFTAFSFIESKPLFFIGEGLLVYSIIGGLVWLQNVYNSEFKSLDDAQKGHREYFSKRNELFGNVWKEIEEKSEIDAEKLTELQVYGQEVLKLFAPQKNEKINRIFSKKLYYLMIAGTICLFSSFFISSLFSKGHKKHHRNYFYEQSF